MLHDRRQRYRERPRKLAHRNAVAELKLRQQRAARWVGKRGKGAVESDVLILNHKVNFRRGARLCQPGCYSRLQPHPH
jgi:hypothetical protein